jgi:4-alpha-glucanotransferase
VLIREALQALGIERLALGIHDACFPGDPSEDIGRGTPNGRGARDFFRFASELGFNTIQLGPQGETSDINPSPYDGSVFVRNTLSIALGALVEDRLLTEETLRTLVVTPGERTDHRHACRAMRTVLDEAVGRAKHTRKNSDQWAVFDAMTDANEGRDFLEWDINSVPSIRVMKRSMLSQELARKQHEATRSAAHALGLELFADLQVGWSRRDLWAFGDCFMRDYRMGAPPSRTNPEGQAWGYPVLDPAAPDRVRALLEKRFARIAAEYDGVRVDHPHGLICPWVYRSGDDVKQGGRLHESPDHPHLRRFAIARREQIDPSHNPWDEQWVRDLDDEQVERYAWKLDLLLKSTPNVLCEVLSTMPYPLGRVLQRYGLGRFRVTQKAALHDPKDVYRSENAQPNDWIMVGNHDTAPIWTVTKKWDGEAHAAYLSERLGQPVARDPLSLARAKLAELFASPAKNVYVWWGDLLGETEWYNQPGTVHEGNWSLRVPPDFRERYASRCAAGTAFELPLALATALRARGHHDLANALRSV